MHGGRSCAERCSRRWEVSSGVRERIGLRPDPYPARTQPRPAARARGRSEPVPQGPFAPVTEEVTAFDLPVVGRIPAS
ncbi:hypothetical protein NKH77_04480 [Streptomyces sp. M19]